MTVSFNPFDPAQAFEVPVLDFGVNPHRLTLAPIRRTGPPRLVDLAAAASGETGHLTFAHAVLLRDE